MKQLILTADDFGLAPEVNEAVEKAHKDGILSTASLMIGGSAAKDAVARAKRMPLLRVGLHVTVVEDIPLLPAGNIPGLVDRNGSLRGDLAAFGAAILVKPSTRRQLRREIRAQFEAYKATGLALDHVNAHLHYHLHPIVLGEILASGLDYGMRALRVPIEPLGVLRRVEPTPTYPVALVVKPWALMMRQRARRAGLVSTDQVFGLSWSGHMTEERLAGLIDNLPEGTTEIYTHPAMPGGHAGAAPGYGYAAELAALLSCRCRNAVERSAAKIGGYSDLL
ncbi:MAG: hopanoid biosynthesis-associated protein HpnK [Hyphomicrobiales bacterium]|nr:hopanoid biosynthesis-associated protein HpnK [Hyphomicrobiales bacterium]